MAKGVLLVSCPSVFPHFPEVLRKYVEKLQIWLNSDKYIGHFTWRRNCVSRCNSDSCRSSTDSALLCFRDNAFSICYTYCSQHICISALQRERNIAFPWRWWVRERAILLRYAYTFSFSLSSSSTTPTTTTTTITSSSSSSPLLLLLLFLLLLLLPLLLLFLLLLILP